MPIARAVTNALLVAVAVAPGAAGCWSWGGDWDLDDHDTTSSSLGSYDAVAVDSDGCSGDACDEAPPCPDPEDCGEDNYCNPACVDSSTQIPTDFDCNVNIPENSNKATVNPNCNCDYWGFVCETMSKCSTTPCQCDPDCHDICDGGLLTACNSDGHCDTWCEKDSDPDCTANSQDNGKWCP